MFSTAIQDLELPWNVWRERQDASSSTADDAADARAARRDEADAAVADARRSSRSSKPVWTQELKRYGLEPGGRVDYSRFLKGTPSTRADAAALADIDALADTPFGGRQRRAERHEHRAAGRVRRRPRRCSRPTRTRRCSSTRSRRCCARRGDRPAEARSLQGVAPRQPEQRQQRARVSCSTARATSSRPTAITSTIPIGRRSRASSSTAASARRCISTTTAASTRCGARRQLEAVRREYDCTTHYPSTGEPGISITLR